VYTVLCINYAKHFKNINTTLELLHSCTVSALKHGLSHAQFFKEKHNAQYTEGKMAYSANIKIKYTEKYINPL